MAMQVYCYGDEIMNLRTANDDLSRMVPVLTSKAGGCMTAANWQEANINIASYELSSLLMKPGIDFLSMLPDLATYVGWQGALVLNASFAKRGVNGLYNLRSDYDGRRTHYSVEDLFALIMHLKPSMVLLPEGVWHTHKALCQSLAETMNLYLSVNDRPEDGESMQPHGVYFSYDEKTTPSSVMLELLAKHRDRSCYIAGDLSLPLMLDLVDNGAHFVESDRPATDALCGDVYCSDGQISLKNSDFSMQFEAIDATCQCTTCSQKLTRAYLHHLLEHTPLLCQRFLVNHNVYYCQEVLRKKRPC